MFTFTVFCQASSGRGTIWISMVRTEHDDVDEARNVGQLHCANDWDCHVDDVYVLGVARGDVDIVYWQEPGR